VYDAVRVVQASIEDGKVVAGGSAPEVEIAMQLVTTRRPSAVEATGSHRLCRRDRNYSKNACRNSGLDPMDSLVGLRPLTNREIKRWGSRFRQEKPTDMWPDVIEPLRTKKQAILSATEAANMILRIDDVIQALRLRKGLRKTRWKACPIKCLIKCERVLPQTFLSVAPLFSVSADL